MSDGELKQVIEKSERTPQLRSMFTGGIPVGGEKVMEPIQLIVTIYKPELEHLDRLRKELKKRGVGELSRDELVRYGINLLSEHDFPRG
jgi:hypothetical protein